MDIPWLEDIWVQPRHDILHLNWVRFCWVTAVMGDDYEEEAQYKHIKWVASFLSWATDLGMLKISMTAETILSFRWNMWYHDYHFSGPRDQWNSGDMYGPDERELKEIANFAWRPEIPRVFHVAMEGVSLHVSRDAAVSSGLFGLLGDTPVQMVDFDANARVREFEGFLFSHALEKEKEPRAADLFKLFKSFQFRNVVSNWAKEAEEIIMMEIWHSA